MGRRQQKRLTLKERAKNLENENNYLREHIEKLNTESKAKGVVLAMSVFPLNFDYLEDFVYQKLDPEEKERFDRDHRGRQ